MELINEWAETVAGWTGLQPWALTVFLFVLGALLLDFVQRLVMRRLGKVVKETKNSWDDAVFDAAVRPLTLLIWLLGISFAAGVMPLFDGTGDFGEDLIVRIRQVGVLYALAWFLVGFIRNVENKIIEQSRKGERKADRTTVRALARIMRITVIITVSLVAMDTLGFNIAGLMAAGGIGGLAVGLAARDLLANFFGGVTVFIDRPFGIGDWVLLKDQGIEGTVEDIGWRQTVIRKFDRRPVYVPNALFTTAAVETPSRMTHRRIYETIGLRYDDIGQVQAITDEVREMLRSHPEIDTSQTLMVHFNAFADSSLDFFIYCLTHTTNWQHYHAVKQDVLLKIADIIEAHGASIAFPTRTVRLQGEPELEGLLPATEQKET